MKPFVRLKLFNAFFLGSILLSGVHTKAEEKPSNRTLFLASPAAIPGAISESKPTVRYWVERDGKEGSRNLYVREDEVYNSGDRVWFKFETNVDGFAYVVSRGSSGKVSLLFPGESGKDNAVLARNPKTIPTEETPFQFDKTPGVEQLLLLVAPERIPELEALASEESPPEVWTIWKNTGLKSRMYSRKSERLTLRDWIPTRNISICRMT